MHYWGEWPDKLFMDVEMAAQEIGDYCRKWGRIQVTQTKEKYGTARVYCHFGIHQLHSITHPGYCYSRYPTWLWKFDCIYISKFFELIRLNIPIVGFQKYIYNKAYQNAIKKYPHIREEILSDADWPEYIDGNEDIMVNWTTTDENGNTVPWTKKGK